MNKTVEMKDIIPIIKEQLNNGGNVSFTPRGNSMLPLFVSNRDVVTLTKPTFPLKKGDVIFYLRDNGSYVLHRIVNIKDGTYTLRGDNQFLNEKGIREDQIIGIVIAFVKNGKEGTVNDFSYRCYSYWWVKSVGIRYYLRRLRRFLGKIKRKLKGIIK